MFSQTRIAVAALYMIIHVLLACRYAVLYWEMRESLFVVTRGLDSLLLNLLASVISVMAICLRQVAADTPPDSPTAFSVACNYMEAATLCMVAWLFPTVMDRGLVLVVKFDPRLRQRYGNYITTRNRGKMLMMWGLCGGILFLLPELFDGQCVVNGCHHPNCPLGNNLMALIPITALQFIGVSFLAWRLSLIDLQQEGLGIMDELYLHAALTQFLFAPSLVINLLLQFDVFKFPEGWEFVNTVLQALGLGVALFASHILPSVRQGFAPEPLASLWYGPLITPERDANSLALPFIVGRSQTAQASGEDDVNVEGNLRKNSATVPPIRSIARSPSNRMLVHSPTARGEGSLASARLLRSPRVGPAFDVWERQFEEWRGMEATLRVQLNNPAFLQYLNEAAAQSTLSPRGALSALSGKKRDFGLGRMDSKKSVKTSPGSPVASARVSPAPESKSTTAEARGTKDAAPIPARDSKQLFDAACVASLVDAARSGLQEEAVRFVLVVLVMRSLDPQNKAHRETIRQHCQFLLATHFDLRNARYRLDVSSEAETAVIREVQKLGRRAVLFADDVSRTMHSFDAAFTQVWPAVYELLANYCLSLGKRDDQKSSSHSQSGNDKTGDENWGIKGRVRLGSITAERRASRRPSYRNSQSGSYESAAAVASSLLSPFAAAGAAIGHRLSLKPLREAGDGQNLSAEDFAEDAEEESLEAGTENPLVVAQDTNPEIAAQDDTSPSRVGRQHERAEEAPLLPHGPEIDPLAERESQSPPAEDLEMSKAPSDLKVTLTLDDHPGLGSGQADGSQAPSLDVKARQPSPSQVQVPPSVRRMSTGGIFTTTPNPILTYSQRLAMEPTAGGSPIAPTTGPSPKHQTGMPA